MPVCFDGVIIVYFEANLVLNIRFIIQKIISRKKTNK